MKKAKFFLTGLFPFFIFDIMLGITSPPVIIVTVALAFIYAKHRAYTDLKLKAPAFLRIVMLLYWAAMAVIIVYFSRILYYFTFYRVVIILAGAGLLFPAVTRKWRPEICAGLMLNLCALLFSVNMLPQGVNDETLDMLMHEKYVRPVYSFLDLEEKNIGNVRPNSEGVRTILADSKDTAIYFTIDHSQEQKAPGKKKESYPVTLVRVSLDRKEDKKIYMGDRLFGLAFTPDEKQLLSTDYNGERLLVFEPGTLQLQDSRGTSSRPQFIIVDPRGERVTVTHEGLGIATVYSLPELKFFKKEKLASAPGKIAIDLETRTFYAANFQYFYMLTEVEIFSLKTSRKKFPFSFDSAGVDLDMKRNRVYLTKGLAGAIIGVDRKTWEVVDRIKTAPFVRPVCVDEKRELILVGNMVDSYVRVYGYDGKLVGKIFIGPNCREIYETPATGRIFAGSNLGLMELYIDRLLEDLAKAKLEKEEASRKKVPEKKKVFIKKLEPAKKKDAPENKEQANKEPEKKEPVKKEPTKKEPAKKK